MQLELSGAKGIVTAKEILPVVRKAAAKHRLGSSLIVIEDGTTGPTTEGTILFKVSPSPFTQRSNFLFFNESIDLTFSGPDNSRQGLAGIESPEPFHRRPRGFTFLEWHDGSAERCDANARQSSLEYGNGECHR